MEIICKSTGFTQRFLPSIDAETANETEQDLLDMENLTLLTITHRIKDGLLGDYDRVLTMGGAGWRIRGGLAI